MPSGPQRARSADESEMHQQTTTLLGKAAEEVDDERRLSILNDVVVLNIPVAHSIAGRFRGRGLATEDLEQAACIALVKAVRGFEPGRGYHFLAYAVPSITGAVKKHFRDSGWMIRPPRSVQELQQRVQAEQSTIDPGTGLAPGDEEIADRLGVDPGVVTEAIGAQGCFTPTSLDQAIGGGTQVLGDVLVAEEDGDLGALEARLVLGPAVARLSRSDRSVLRMRFVHDLTQGEIAARLGVSQPVVSRLIGRILEELSRMLKAPGRASDAA